MKKFLLPIGVICLTLFLLVACSDKDAGNENNEKEEENEENVDEIDVELTIEELSDTLIKALDNRDMELVATYVHPEKGLLFSPYVYVTDAAVVLNKNEVDQMMDRDQIKQWGIYDGKGSPIELAPSEYFDEFLDMTPFLEPDDILINDLQERGNTLNNVQEVFPDAQIIEYYNGGSEEYAGIDWSSVLLVYETNANESLQLIAIIRDMWTI